MLKDKIPLMKSQSQYYDHRQEAFLKRANEITDLINEKIDLYESESESDKKLLILRQINQLRVNLEDLYPQELNAPDFEEKILIKLYKDCQEECKNLGTSISELDADQQIIAGFDDTPIAKLLADLDPELVADMLSALSSGGQIKQKWSGFVQKLKDNNHLEWVAILNQYDIEVLGGGNAKNFKLICLDPKSPHIIVLRIDNRLGESRADDAYLRTTPLQRVLTPVASPRTVTFDINGKKLHQTLLLTTVCSQGTPLAHADRNPNPEDRIDQALNVYEQMCEILRLIEQQSYFFPDAKNANWLLDDQLNLRIADTKSLVLAPDGKYNMKNTGRFTAPGLIRTSGFISQEMQTFQIPFDVDTAHSYILGKNIHQFLTKNSMPSIFLSFKGKKLKQLIESLTKDPAAKRMGLKDAMVELQTLKLLFNAESLIQQIEAYTQKFNIDTKPWLQQKRDTLASLAVGKDDEARFTLVKELATFFVNIQEENDKKRYYCEQLLLDLDKSSLDPTADEALTRWIDQKDAQLDSISSDQEYADFCQEIIQITKENRFISDFIRNVNDKPIHIGKAYGIGAKKAAILEALYQIPPPERGKIMDTHYSSPQIINLRAALGIERTSLGNYTPMFPNRSTQFQKYKKQFDALKEQQAENNIQPTHNKGI